MARFNSWRLLRVIWDIRSLSVGFLGPPYLASSTPREYARKKKQKEGKKGRQGGSPLNVRVRLSSVLLVVSSATVHFVVAKKA